MMAEHKLPHRRDRTPHNGCHSLIAFIIRNDFSAQEILGLTDGVLYQMVPRCNFFLFEKLTELNIQTRAALERLLETTEELDGDSSSQGDHRLS